MKDILSIVPGLATIALYLLGSWIQSARRLSRVLFTLSVLLQFGKIYMCDFSKGMDCVCFNWRKKCLIAHKVHLQLVHTTTNSRLCGSNLVNIARFTIAIVVEYNLYWITFKVNVSICSWYPKILIKLFINGIW